MTLEADTATWFYFTTAQRVGSSVPANLKTGRLDFGSEVTHKRFQSIDVTADATGSSLRADLSLNGNTDRLGTTINLGLGRVSEDAAGNNWLVWTRGNWDDSKWAELQTKTYQAHKRFPVHAKGVDAQLEISSTHIQDTQLSGIDLFIIPIGGAY